jgi:hypothetical protein
VNSSKAFSIFANPFFTWGRLAWNAGEMAMASTQVIGHRTRRLALAGTHPSVHDQREFVLMGQEKLQAVADAAQAAGMRLLMLNQQFAALALKQMLSAAGSLMSIATSRTAAESVERQSKFLRDTMASSAVTASKLSGATTQLAQRALAPVYARVKGNVRRLGRKSR